MKRNGKSFKTLAEFFEKFKSVHYKKGENILRAGDVPLGITFIKSGYCRLYSISEDGKELTLVIYKPGDFFPVVWTFEERPSIYYFQALSPVEAKRASRAEFIKLLDSNSDIFFYVNEHILQRFQVALRRMEYLTFGNAGAKLASILLICAKEFGMEKNRQQTLIPIPFTHKGLADLVGQTRETISIELKKLEKKKLIGYNKRLIVINDQKGLEKEAILT